MESHIQEESEREDEMIALAAIYPKRVFMRVANEPAGLISVSPVLAEADELVVRFGTNAEERELSVKHLLPYTLTFQLPEDYPMSSPPQYSLKCDCLSEEQIATLCSHLDSLWTPECGVVLFSWVQFLIDDSLSALGVFPADGTQPSLLVGAAPETNGSEPAVARVGSYRDLRIKMQGFDEEQRAREFRESGHECEVCFSSKSGKECTQFVPCRHGFCSECVSEYFRVQISDGAVTSMHCMIPECDTEALPTQVKSHVSSDLYDKYERLLLERGLESMDDIVRCPARHCQKPVLKEVTASNMATCPACTLVFCVLCRRTWHGINPCPVSHAQKSKLIKQYQDSNKEEKAALIKRYGSLIQRYLEESISEEWLDENSKACPTCGCHIQKTEGCNKMTCSRCRNHFCWMCLANLNRTDPYKHFSDRKTDCYNRLFDGMVEGDDFFEDDDWFEEDLV